jgi:ADP-heptose:LPS heptosyltransferase
VASRLGSRLRIAPRALLRRFAGRRAKPRDPRRILVAHNLLLGDTLMLTALLAKLRERHRDAHIAMTVSRAVAPLYGGRPYGVEAIPFEPRERATLEALLAQPGYDLAFVPGDNRYAWLAAAAGARWIVAHAGDRPGYKSWPVDELRPYPQTPAAWGDMVAMLADGPPPSPFRPEDWPSPVCAAFEPPAGRYAVLHVQASTPLRHWEEGRWLELAGALERTGCEPVWSAGPGGEALLKRVDPGGRFRALGHRLDLAQLWHLVSRARLLVCVDTGVAHMGRLAGTPTVTLFGPGSPGLFGAGRFWSQSPWRAVTVDPFPCRDQRTLFKREIAWVRRCQRTLAECPAPRCMHAIETAAVLEAVATLLRP